MATEFPDNMIAVQNAYDLCDNPLTFGDDANLAHAENKIKWYEKWADGIMVPINWFVNKIAKPYVDKTNALNPSWTKYLCHVALVFGLILVPLSFVLCCYIA